MVSNLLDIRHVQKFSIVPRPTVAPGCCAFTGKHEDEFFIDLGLFLDYYGAIYMSSSYFKNILRFLLAGGQLEDVIPPVERAEGPLNPPEMVENLGQIQEQLSGLSTSLFDLIRSVSEYNDSLLAEPAPSIVVERNEKPRSGSGKADRKITKSESGSVESFDESQLERVSDSDSHPGLDI